MSRRRRRRYVRDDEIKRRDRLPEDGQPVYCRLIGYKSYYLTTYDAVAGLFRHASGQAFDKSYVMGWLPVPKTPISDLSCNTG